MKGKQKNMKLNFYSLHTSENISSKLGNYKNLTTLDVLKKVFVAIEISQQRHTNEWNLELVANEKKKNNAKSKKRKFIFFHIDTKLFKFVIFLLLFHHRQHHALGL